MKKYVFLTLLVIVTLSCTNTQKQDPVQSQIGFEVADDGTKIPLYAGALSTVELWEKYIKAHNDRDLEAIREMNAENFKAYGPNGEIIDGTDAHIEFLASWFEAANPVWKSNYFIANEFTNQKDKLREWVTSGHDVTMSVEGETIEVGQVHDALIVDGKIQMFYVYEIAKASSEEE